MHITIQTITYSQYCLGAYIQIPTFWKLYVGGLRKGANVLKKRINFGLLFQKILTKHILM